MTARLRRDKFLAERLRLTVQPHASVFSRDGEVSIREQLG